MDPIEKIIASGEAGLWAQAERKYQAEVDKNPNNSEARELLASVYRQSGQWKKAQGMDRPATADIDPPRFLIRRPFLPPSQRDALLDLFRREEGKMEELGVGRAKDGKLIGETFDRSIRFQFGTFCEAELEQIFQPFVNRLFDEFCLALGVEPFEQGSHQMRLDYTPDGGFGSAHQDRGLGARLSYLYYFHTHPKQWSGGDLILFDRDIASNEPIATRFTRIPIEDNMLLVFRPHDFHQVTRVKAIDPPLSPIDSRLSVCGFIHP